MTAVPVVCEPWGDLGAVALCLFLNAAEIDIDDFAAARWLAEVDSHVDLLDPYHYRILV